MTTTTAVALAIFIVTYILIFGRLCTLAEQERENTNAENKESFHILYIDRQTRVCRL